MKLTKTVKYNYKLTEETLEKDMDKFIESAKKGDFHMDKMYGNEGLKMIKQYFKILNEKFKNNELEECKRCYQKFIPFLIKASSAENDLFDYEDLLAKITKDFDDYVKNYFICLVKTCSLDELSDRIARYASSLDIYGFDSDKEILLNNLSKEQLNQIEEKILAKTQGMTKKDQDTQDIVYFLISIADVQGDKQKYLRLCERFREILSKEEFECLKNGYEENEMFNEKFDNAMGELKKSSQTNPAL